MPKTTNNLPLFASIKTIIINNTHIYLLVSQYQTVQYVDYLGGYMLRPVETMDKLFQFEELSSIWPLDCYDLDNNLKFVIPKYYI